MDLPEIVKKLTGPIQPVGESNADHDRIENLETVIELTESLILDLIKVSQNDIRTEASMKVMGVRARVALHTIMDTIDCNVNP